MMKTTDKWAYSLDGEWYNSPFYNSFEEALKEGIKEAKELEYDKVFVSRVMRFVPSVDVDNVLEELQQKAYDEAGDFSDDYLEHISINHRMKLEKMLTETFNQWAKETNNEPSFFTVNVNIM